MLKRLGEKRIDGKRTCEMKIDSGLSSPDRLQDPHDLSHNPPHDLPHNPQHDLPHVRIADAAFPAPFRSGLEYSSPARGTWNIVHTCMLVPQAHLIYVCAAGCLRGVVLTAAEMGAMDRFSTIAIREHNLLDGDMEDLIIEGVTDIIGKLPKRPPAVMVHTSCVHHFTGTDLDVVYRELRSRFPDIDFADCYMNPIMRKSGLTPDQLMRSRIYMPLHDRPVDPKAAAIVGSDMPTDRESDLMELLQADGLKVHEITSCRNYAEYQQMAEAKVFISLNPDAAPGADMLAERLGRPHYKLRFSFDYDEIDETFAGLAELLEAGIDCGSQTRSETGKFEESPVLAETGEGEASPLRSEQIQTEQIGSESGSQTRLSKWSKWSETRRAECEDALVETRKLIGSTPVAIDYTFCPRPFGLAKLLLDHGFNVTKIYADSVPGSDKTDFEYLQSAWPELLIYPTVHAGMRFANSVNRQNHTYPPASEGKMNPDHGSCISPDPASNRGSCTGSEKCRVLAIGQKAAYFENTDNFVNIVEGGGMIGYEAVTRTCSLMRDAYMNKKEMRELVQVKGLGCEICVH